MRSFSFKLTGAIALLALVSSSVFAQSFRTRELNVDGTELNDHYESYSFLTSSVDQTWLDNNGLAFIDDFNDFFCDVDTVDFGGNGGNFPDEATNNGDCGYVLGVDYAIDARANVTVPAGTWTIAFGTDDGGQLTLAGANFFGGFRITDQLNKTATVVAAAAT